MKIVNRSLSLLGFAATACAASAQYGVFWNSPIVIPAFPREFRGAWVATVFNIDWPSGTTLTNAQQQAEAITILNAAQELNMTSLLVQVRSQADSMYQSTIEPWGKPLKGTIGTGPSPIYDPLAYWITQAHLRGIEIHAWVNPYRALTSTSNFAPNSHISKTMPTECDVYGSALWIDPSSPSGSQQTKNVINYIVSNYDVDGICFDDYFYPYPISGTPYPDSDSYLAYTSGGGTLSLANWRRKNIDDLVQAVNLNIHTLKPWVKFGIGPFGIWQPGYPAGVTGTNAYSELYADSRKWLQQGWVDYLAPQLYWKISSTGQPYDDLINWWAQQNTANRIVLASNYTSQLLTSTWPAQEILDQITVTRATPGASGNIHYSMKPLKNDTLGIKTSLKANQYSKQCLIPAYTWLDSVAPATPTVNYSINKSAGTQTISWTPNGSEAATWYAVSYLIGTTWTQKVYTPATTSLTLPVKNSGSALRAFGVASVDRCGNMSPWMQGILDPSVLGSGTTRDASGGVEDEVMPSLPGRDLPPATRR